MKAGCVICSDCFETSEDTDVSALPCGHLFHAVCIHQWITNSVKSTCPTCRQQFDSRKIIPKLYFDNQGEENDEEDYGKIKNEKDNLKLKLREKDTEINKIIEDKDFLQEKYEKLEKGKKGVERALKTEQGTCIALRTQLTYLESQRDEANMAIKEARILRKKLQDLQNVEKVIKDSESDVLTILDSYGTGEGAMKTMATFIVSLKRELRTIKDERKTLREENQKLKPIVSNLKMELKHRTLELEKLKGQIEQMDCELRSKCRKIDKLQKALGSPSDSAVSFAHRLLHESPAPNLTPTLSKPCNSQDEIDFEADENFFVPNTPEVVKPSPNTQAKRECQQHDIKFVKFSKAGLNPVKKQKMDDDVPLRQFNILKKKAPDSTSILRLGYNGLGGHKNHVNLPQQQKSIFKAPAPKKQKIRIVKSTKMPSLPSMDDFMS